MSIFDRLAERYERDAQEADLQWQREQREAWMREWDRTHAQIAHAVQGLTRILRHPELGIEGPIIHDRSARGGLHKWELLLDDDRGRVVSASLQFVESPATSSPESGRLCLSRPEQRPIYLDLMRKVLSYDNTSGFDGGNADPHYALFLRVEGEPAQTAAFCRELGALVNGQRNPTAPSNLPPYKENHS